MWCPPMPNSVPGKRCTRYRRICRATHSLVRDSASGAAPSRSDAAGWPNAQPPPPRSGSCPSSSPMSSVAMAGFLALCAALASAIGNVIRQRSAQEVTDRQVGHLTLFGMLLRDTRWWLGGLGDIASYVFLAWALDNGSVLLVMSLQVTALLFALPIYARLTR